jgi:hypothetical protein
MAAAGFRLTAVLTTVAESDFFNVGALLPFDTVVSTERLGVDFLLQLSAASNMSAATITGNLFCMAVF